MDFYELVNYVFFSPVCFGRVLSSVKRLDTNGFKFPAKPSSPVIFSSLGKTKIVLVRLLSRVGNLASWRPNNSILAFVFPLWPRKLGFLASKSDQQNALSLLKTHHHLTGCLKRQQAYYSLGHSVPRRVWFSAPVDVRSSIATK